MNKDQHLDQPTFMFAIVTKDIAGQTIQLFKTKKQAETFYEELTKPKPVKSHPWRTYKIRKEV